MPASTFDAPFPKRNTRLANVLGDQLTLKSGDDTLTLTIASGKTTNLITNKETGDTVFFGTVSKFRGLYYFSQQLNDSSYWIYPIKISDNLIYGLNMGWVQLFAVDDEIKNGNHKKLVKYINADSSIIRLHPNKRELKKLYSNIIDRIYPDTIIDYQQMIAKTTDTTNTVSAIDPEDFDYILKAYPNPTAGEITIELQEKSKSSFQLTDLNGKVMLQGPLNEISTRIDLSKQHAGVYSLTVMNSAEKEKETIKIIKTD
jgi:hypothetical protein